MKKVLIVDDTAFMRMAIKNILVNNGFDEIEEAANGLDGLQKYKALRPDIVTMDITMPGMTGLEALKLIMEYDSSAKVVMVSAMGQETMVKEAIMYGAKSFIIKPFKEEHVITTISKILSI